jgi:hypothetical protein
VTHDCCHVVPKFIPSKPLYIDHLDERTRERDPYPYKNAEQT